MWNNTLFWLVFHYMWLINGDCQWYFTYGMDTLGWDRKQEAENCRKSCQDDFVSNCPFGVVVRGGVCISTSGIGELAVGDPSHSMCSCDYRKMAKHVAVECEYQDGIFTYQQCQTQCDHLRLLGDCDYGFYFNERSGNGRYCCIAKALNFKPSSSGDLFRCICGWLSSADKRSTEGVEMREYKTLAKCKEECTKREGCKSIDWAAQSKKKCWFVFGENYQKSKEDVVHFKHYCFHTNCNWRKIENVAGVNYTKSSNDDQALCQQQCQELRMIGKCQYGYQFDGGASYGHRCGIVETEKQSYRRGTTLHQCVVEESVTRAITKETKKRTVPRRFDKQYLDKDDIYYDTAWRLADGRILAIALVLVSQVLSFSCGSVAFG